MSKGKMDLPSGKTCKDCAHFSVRCSWLVGAKPDWKACDFSPHRFKPKPPAQEDIKHGQD